MTKTTIQVKDVIHFKLVWSDDCSQPKTNGETKTMTNRTGYYIAPYYDFTDTYAAGYDGNQFDTEAEAEAAIPNLASALDTGADYWTVESY